MNENTIREFANMCQKITRCKFQEYSDEMKNLIINIQDKPHDNEFYNNLIENYKTDFAVISTILKKDDISAEIVERIANECLPELSKDVGKHTDKDLALGKLVNKVLHKEISEKTIDNLVKRFPSHVKGTIIDNESKSIPQKNVGALCDSFLKRKALRANPLQTPFVLIKDDAVAFACLYHSPKCDETVATPIAMNENLSDEVRNEAFDFGVDFNRLYLTQYGVTEHMVKEIYDCIIQSYSELELNPLTYSKKRYNKEMVKTFERSCEYLYDLISNDLLPESLQNDLFNRIVSLKQKSQNRILQRLLMKTKSKYIFDNLDLIQNQRDVVYALINNKNIPENVMNEKIDKYYKILKTRKASSPEYVLHLFYHLAKTRELNDEIIKTICGFSIYHYGIVKSPYVSKEILNLISEKYKNEIYKHGSPILYNALFNNVVRSTGFDIEKQNYLLQNFHVFPLNRLSMKKGEPENQSYNFEKEIEKHAEKMFALNSDFDHNPLTKDDKIKLRETLKNFADNCEDREYKLCYDAFVKMFKCVDNLESTKNKEITENNLLKIKYELYNNIHTFSSKNSVNPENFFLDIDDFAKNCIDTMNKIRSLGDDISGMKEIHEFLNYIENGVKEFETEICER